MGRKKEYKKEKGNKKRGKGREKYDVRKVERGKRTKGKINGRNMIMKHK